MAKSVEESKANAREIAKRTGLDELELEAPVRRAFTSTKYAQKMLGEDVVNQFPVTQRQYDIAKPLLEETDEERIEREKLEAEDVIGLEEVPHFTLSKDAWMKGDHKELLGDDYTF